MAGMVHWRLGRQGRMGGMGWSGRKRLTAQILPIPAFLAFLPNEALIIAIDGPPRGKGTVARPRSPPSVAYRHVDSVRCIERSAGKRFATPVRSTTRMRWPRSAAASRIEVKPSMSRSTGPTSRADPHARHRPRGNGRGAACRRFAPCRRAPARRGRQPRHRDGRPRHRTVGSRMPREDLFDATPEERARRRARIPRIPAARDSRRRRHGARRARPDRSTRKTSPLVVADMR